MNIEQKYLIQIIRTILNPDGSKEQSEFAQNTTQGQSSSSSSSSYEQSSSQEISSEANKISGQSPKISSEAIKRNPQGQHHEVGASSSSAPSTKDERELCASAPLREIETVDIDKLFAISTAQGVAGLVAKAMTTSHPTPHTSHLNSNLQKKFEFLASLATQEDDYKKKEEALRSLVEYINDNSESCNANVNGNVNHYAGDNDKANDKKVPVDVPVNVEKIPVPVPVKIGLILLKGISLSQYWPIPNHRPCGDIDILPFRLTTHPDGQPMPMPKPTYTQSVSPTFSTCSQQVDELIENQGAFITGKTDKKHSKIIWDGVMVENHRTPVENEPILNLAFNNTVLNEAIEKFGLECLNLDSVESSEKDGLGLRALGLSESSSPYAQSASSENNSLNSQLSTLNSQPPHLTSHIPHLTPLYTLAPEPNYLFLICHMVIHTCSSGTLLLRHFIDLALYLDNHRDMDIDYVNAQLKRMGYTRIKDFYLHIAQYITGIDFSQFCEEIGELGNQGTRDSGNQGFGESENSHLTSHTPRTESDPSHISHLTPLGQNPTHPTSHISHPSQNPVLTPDESRFLKEIFENPEEDDDDDHPKSLMAQYRNRFHRRWRYRYIRHSMYKDLWHITLVYGQSYQNAIIRHIKKLFQK